MGKLEDIKDYIYRCDRQIENISDTKGSKDLEEEIIGVYNNDIPNIKTSLDLYRSRIIPTGSSINIDFHGDLVKLKAKLRNFESNLEAEKELRDYNLVMMQQKNQGIKVTTNNVNNNESMANSSSTVSLTFTFDQVLEIINSFPEDALSQTEKDDLEDKIAAIEMALQNKDKTKILSKISNVFKFVAEKTLDIGIALLPYLIQASVNAQAIM